MESNDMEKLLVQNEKAKEYRYKAEAHEPESVNITTCDMTSTKKPLIELFVKSAATDKQEKGPCLIGQQWFMTFYSLVEKGVIDLRFTPMSLEMPPPDYTRLCAARHLPIAWVVSGSIRGVNMTNCVISSNAALEGLMQQLGLPNLNSRISSADVLAVEELFEDLYISMINFIRYDNQKPLLKVLTNLDGFLAQNAHSYLLDDNLSYVDCQLMPKLQHLRVACRAYKDFDIPFHLTYLWNYVTKMYETEAFKSSCPSNRDMLLHYQEKYPLPKNTRLSLCGSECLFEVPSLVSPTGSAEQWGTDSVEAELEKK